MAWVRVILFGVCKWPMKALAPFVVPFLSMYQRVRHPIFGVRDAGPEDRTWWNIGVRNACHNMVTIDMPQFTTTANTTDHSLEKIHGFQWRYRRSLDGKYVSFRCTWGAPRMQKGKREFYIGWTLNDEAYARLTFFQLRPF